MCATRSACLLKYLQIRNLWWTFREQGNPKENEMLELTEQKGPILFARNSKFIAFKLCVICDTVASAVERIDSLCEWSPIFFMRPADSSSHWKIVRDSVTTKPHRTKSIVERRRWRRREKGLNKLGKRWRSTWIIKPTHYRVNNRRAPSHTFAFHLRKLTKIPLFARIVRA